MLGAFHTLPVVLAPLFGAVHLWEIDLWCWSSQDAQLMAGHYVKMNVSFYVLLFDKRRR